MFDNIKPLDPIWERRKKQIWIAAAVVVVAAPILFFYFKNWPEERVVQRFCTALEQGNYAEAYLIWQPAASYRNEDFLRDWGPQSEYGKISRFQITRSRARGSGVIVTVRLNQKQARIWVEKRNKSLSFPPW